MHGDKSMTAFGRSIIVSRSDLDQSALADEPDQTQHFKVGQRVKQIGDQKDDQLGPRTPVLRSVLRSACKPPISPKATRIIVPEANPDTYPAVAADGSPQLTPRRKLRKLDRFRESDFDVTTIELISSIDNEYR